jgi:hypothetical protein
MERGETGVSPQAMRRKIPARLSVMCRKYMEFSNIQILLENS